MKIKIIISLILLNAFYTVTCLAATTPKGSSGLINIPSAYISRDWKFNIGYFNTRYGSSVAGNISLPFGAEVAYSKWHMNDKNNRDMLSVKFPVMHEKVMKPAIAVGVEDMADDFDRSYYLAMSKQGPWGIRMHMGVRSGREQKGMFYGIEKQIRLKGEITKQKLFVPAINFTLEYDGRRPNYGMYIRNSNGFRVDFAWHKNSFRFGIQKEF